MDVLYPLRVLMGRQLGPTAMKHASEGRREQYCSLSQWVSFKSYFHIPDTQKIIYRSTYSDMSESCWVDRVYTIDGRLIREQITRNVTDPIEIKTFDPPGRFKCKKEIIPPRAA